MVTDHTPTMYLNHRVFASEANSISTNSGAELRTTRIDSSYRRASRRSFWTTSILEATVQRVHYLLDELTTFSLATKCRDDFYISKPVCSP